MHRLQLAACDPQRGVRALCNFKGTLHLTLLPRRDRARSMLYCRHARGATVTNARYTYMHRWCTAYIQRTHARERMMTESILLMVWMRRVGGYA